MKTKDKWIEKDFCESGSVASFVALTREPNKDETKAHMNSNLKLFNVVLPPLAIDRNLESCQYHFFKKCCHVAMLPAFVDTIIA